LEIAKGYGAELIINPDRNDPVEMVENWTGSYGADAVLFTASTNKSGPLSQSFKMCKKKGRVVLVGVSGMELERNDIYYKELDFLISTSYGPGRYDKQYEEKGLTYPYNYVRWTENRNLLEYLRLLEDGSIRLNKLIQAVFPLEKVGEAFESFKIYEKKPLMVLLNYEVNHPYEIKNIPREERKIVLNNLSSNKKILNVAIVGAGNFAKAVYLPILEKLKNKFRIYAIMNQTGLKAKLIAEQYNAHYATTNYDDILRDENVDLVIISTRHDSHSKLVLKALTAGKNVFVEKPLATTLEELNKIEDFFNKKQSESASVPFFMVGFNRRFSLYAKEIKKHVDQRINPLMVHYRMNAGYIPMDSWVHEDGGRIIGEACHVIDLMTYFIGSSIVSISCESLTPKTDKYSATDNKAILLKYKDGSVCSIEYFANGGKDLSKEYMEIHFDNKSIVLDDYRAVKGYNLKIVEIKSAIAEKGHLQEFEKVYEMISSNTGEMPIKLDELIETTKASFLISKLNE
jgi:predicted dehydrogenase